MVDRGIWGVLFAVLFVGCGTNNDPSITDDASSLHNSDAATSTADAGSELFRVQFVDPANGPYLGGTEITIRGNGFSPDAVAFVGNRQVEPLDQEIIDSRRMRIRTPPGAPGPADVVVRRTVTEDEARLEGGFHYDAFEVDPPSGSVTGGTQVTITGFGTHFGNQTAVRFDGRSLVDLNIVSETVLTGRTPPNVAGPADVEIKTSATTHRAGGAFAYLATADPFGGGMGGGPIQGDANIVVLDEITKNGVDGAFVRVTVADGTTLQGTADELGQISFSDASLLGTITTTAAKEGYETASFVRYDSRDLTILLRPHVNPVPGPGPPSPQNGRILGHVLFGESVGLGSPTWDLVPEPRTETEVKRVYVSTTYQGILSKPLGAAVIDYEGFDPQKTLWPFEIPARAAATAVVAIAGLYDPITDHFDPYALGVARGVLVGPAEEVVGIDVPINIALDNDITVLLDTPPPIGTAGWSGPTEYSIRPFIDLGGEGLISMNLHGTPEKPEPEPPPGTFVFEPGTSSIELKAMAPLSRNLADATYTFMVGAYSGGTKQPASVRIERAVANVVEPVVIGDFLGVPRPTDPIANGTASTHAVEFAPEGPPSSPATFHLHLFRSGGLTRLLRVLARGDQQRIPIPDLRNTGAPEFPTNQSVLWTVFSVKTPALTFDDFTYRHLGVDYWTAYATASSLVLIPPPESSSP